MNDALTPKAICRALDEQLTMETKKTCDLEYQKRAIKFMEKSVKADKPFYCYFNHSLMHFPMSPRDEFVGKSDNGEWGDCLLMLDHDFGVLLDKLDELGVRDNTIVVMCGDNGAVMPATAAWRLTIFQNIWRVMPLPRAVTNNASLSCRPRIAARTSDK